jgi:hypothetical protein
MQTLLVGPTGYRRLSANVCKERETKICLTSCVADGIPFATLIFP